MPAPEPIPGLVDRFETHLEAYRSGRYNETQIRRDFLDPFYEALARTPAEQTALARQIATMDWQMDRLVYELYGLTDEEVKIVEGGR